MKERVEFEDEELNEPTQECVKDSSYGASFNSQSILDPFACPSTSQQPTADSSKSTQQLQANSYVAKSGNKKIYVQNRTKLSAESVLKILLDSPSVLKQIKSVVKLDVEQLPVLNLLKTSVVGLVQTTETVKRPYIKSVVGPGLMQASPSEDDGGEFITGIESDITRNTSEDTNSFSAESRSNAPSAFQFVDVQCSLSEL
jgi:hypothetical protein